MSEVLRTDRLTVSVGEFTLGPISLALERSDYLVLLGPSGCGKTTLLRSVAGFLPVGPRTIFLEGRDVSQDPPQRRRIGYVAQHADLFPHLTVAENIAFGLRYAPVPRDKRAAHVARIARLMGVDGFLSRAPDTLSGGEARRVALARSLAVRPRVLLLDEPLSMLDPNARAGMRRALAAVHEELGTATIHVTHDREEAWSMRSRVAVMHAGRIEQTGPVEVLFRRPRAMFVARFLGAGDVVPARFEQQAGQWTARVGRARLPVSEPPRAVRGHVFVRPGALRLAADDERAEAQGTVRGLADRGRWREVSVEVEGETPLTVHALEEEDRLPRPGEAVGLRVLGPVHPLIEESPSPEEVQA